MAIKGISVVEQWRFASVLDTATEDNEKTWFVLGALTVAVRAYINDNSFLVVAGPESGRAILDKTSHRNLEAVRFGLRGVENFRMPDGKEITLTFGKRSVGGEEYSVVSDEALSHFPPVIIAELGEEILAKNIMSDDLRKKLSPQSSQQNSTDSSTAQTAGSDSKQSEGA